MIVYFLRHANAGIKRPNPVQDEKRPLVKEGIEQCRYVGRLLSALDAHVDLVLSSPLKRATQSASMVANEIAYEQKIELTPALSPNADYEAFRKLLLSHAELEALMVVGHNPNMSRFLSLLITGGLSARAVEMKKGSVARVEIGAKRATLNWLINPRILKSVYSSGQSSGHTSTQSSSRPKTSAK